MLKTWWKLVSKSINFCLQRILEPSSTFIFYQREWGTSMHCYILYCRKHTFLKFAIKTSLPFVLVNVFKQFISIFPCFNPQQNAASFRFASILRVQGWVRYTHKRDIIFPLSCKRHLTIQHDVKENIACKHNKNIMNIGRWILTAYLVLTWQCGHGETLHQFLAQLC